MEREHEMGEEALLLALGEESFNLRALGKRLRGRRSADETAFRACRSRLLSFPGACHAFSLTPPLCRFGSQRLLPGDVRGFTARLERSCEALCTSASAHGGSGASGPPNSSATAAA